MSQAKPQLSPAEHGQRLSAQLQAMADAPLEPQAFFRGFVNAVRNLPPVSAVAVWLADDEGQLKPYCESGLENPSLQSLANNSGHQQLLLEAAADGVSRWFPPRKAAHASDPEPSLESHPLPISDGILFTPLQHGPRLLGVVELLLQLQEPDATTPGIVAPFEDICRHAALFLARRADAKAAAKQSEFAVELERLSLRLHGSLRSRDIAYAAANDGRLTLGCDRLSVVFARGRRTHVAAISGQSSVNRRSNLVRALNALSAVVLPARELFHFNGQPRDWPPQVEETLAEYVQVGGARSLAIVPLLETPAQRPADHPAANNDLAKRKVLGGLVAEQVSSTVDDAAFVQNLQNYADHVATAISNARRYESIFLLPIWRLLGGVAAGLRGRTLAKTLAVFVLMVGIALTLALVKWDYTVSARGQLMPVQRRAVFAPWDGQVAALHVDSGQEVDRGQTLIELHNDDLSGQILAARNELAELQEQQVAWELQLNEALRTEIRTDELQVQGELAKTEALLQAKREQVKLLSDVESQLTVRAPIAGVVATFGIEELLTQRPLHHGDLLLEIMDTDGPWRLEVEIPDHRVGHVLEARAAMGADPLRVEFVLSTHPERVFEGWLETVSTTANLSETVGNVVIAYVSTTAEQLPDRSIGTEVQAKIHCRRRSLAYVLFGDIWEFFQSRFWW